GRRPELSGCPEPRGALLPVPRQALYSRFPDHAVAAEPEHQSLCAWRPGSQREDALGSAQRDAVYRAEAADQKRQYGLAANTFSRRRWWRLVLCRSVYLWAKRNRAGTNTA